MSLQAMTDLKHLIRMSLQAMTDLKRDEETSLTSGYDWK